jgi:hypothetical protein
MVKAKRVNTPIVKLTPEQLSKLRALAHPERWVDESFNRTDIGAFLLKEHLIVPNPEHGTRKAYIVTAEGLQTIKVAKK